MSANGLGCRKKPCARKSLSSEEDVSLKEQFVRKSLSSEEWRALK